MVSSSEGSHEIKLFRIRLSEMSVDGARTRHPFHQQTNMSASSPASSLVSATESPNPSHGHHPPYDRLILRLFRSTKSKSLHLASIRSMFAKLYGRKYWFPPSWPRHVYQRLREMERKGGVVSEGPHQLYFRPIVARPVKKVKRAETEKRKKMAERENIADDKRSEKIRKPSKTKRAPIKTKDLIQEPAVEIGVPPKASDLTSSLEKCLEAVAPLEELGRLENRVASQIQIVQNLLNAFMSDDLSMIQEVQTSMDDLLEQPRTLSFDQIRQLCDTLQELAYKFPANGGPFITTFNEAIQTLLHRIGDGSHLIIAEFGEALSTISTLILALMTTVHMLRHQLAVSDDRETHFKTLIVALEQDLGKSRDLLGLREEQVGFHSEQLELLNNEILVKTEEVRKSLASVLDDFDQKIEEQGRLLNGDRAHYESVISGLEAQLAEESSLKAMEVDMIQNDLLEARTEMKATEVRADDLEEEMKNLQLLSSEHEQRINEMASEIDEREEKMALMRDERDQLCRTLEQIRGMLKSVESPLDQIKEVFQSVRAQLDNIDQ